MPVDNTVYDRMADSWWEEGGFLHLLAALNPARFGYMRRVLTEELHLSIPGWGLLSCDAISADGTVITGYGLFSASSIVRAWAAVIPAPTSAFAVGLGYVLLGARRRR